MLLLLPAGMVGLLGSPSLDHQLQQAVIQMLALGMELALAKVEAEAEAAAAAGGGNSSSSSHTGPDWGDTEPGVSCSLHKLPQLGVYVVYMSGLQQLLQRHGGRLLAGGDPGTALQLVARLRGMAAAHQQVR